MRYVFYFALLAVVTQWSFKKPAPVLHIIGDSTEKTGQGKGENEMWGWGKYYT
jgi:rhamnogalacturonan acetylesterase